AATLLALAAITVSTQPARADVGSPDRALSPGIAPPELLSAASMATPDGRARALVLDLAPGLGKPVLVVEHLGTLPDGRLALVSQRPLERLKIGPHDAPASDLDALTDLHATSDHFTFKARAPQGHWRCTLALAATNLSLSGPLTATCEGRFRPLAAPKAASSALTTACERASTDASACRREAQLLSIAPPQLAPIVAACDRATSTPATLIACLQALRSPDAAGRDPGILVDLIEACRGATSSESLTLACLRRSLSW
ncbi:MAG: hypothetical protein JNJ59_11690, partial [Deltaproteobacteria bacterium]|nr:hypothetical protein [Deltaproteobacteria bacterium]